MVLLLAAKLKLTLQIASFKTTKSEYIVNVSTKELRRALEIVLKDLEEMGLDTITVSKDYYWKVPINEIFDMQNLPSSNNCGQLSDDLKDLKKIISDGYSTFTSLLLFPGILNYIALIPFEELEVMRAQTAESKQDDGQDEKK